ncbi:FecR domain-containing protein [Geminicoccus flavidas]|uniref:FecR domain-containing protein n=1 Tax=Geminicoccus flavidas TaxID=2506407 RepID=UPI001358F82C|nr:FecR domain-containing protein [Geminicoccus flavidas]
MDGRDTGFSGLPRRGLVAGMLAVAATGADPAWAQAAGIGHVQSLRGQAFAQSGQVRRPLAVQAPLYLGDLVLTGADARLRLRLGRRTTLALGANARLRIDRFALASEAGGFELQAGPLLLEHDENGPSIGSTVQSPYALIAVRGTRFFAGPSNDVFGVFVATGRVSVQAAGQSVLLDPGEGTNIPRLGAPPSPVAPWGAARIQAALASVE